jgi:hypothetical protein
VADWTPEQWVTLVTGVTGQAVILAGVFTLFIQNYFRAKRGEGVVAELKANTEVTREVQRSVEAVTEAVKTGNSGKLPQREANRQ